VTPPVAGILRGAIGLARGFDRAAGRLSGRRVVLFEARTPMNVSVLRPVFEPLLEDPRILVRFTGSPRPDLSRAFTELGLSGRVISRARATWARVDLYANADPWEAVPLRRAARQLNFFHGVAGKYDLDCPVGLPLAFDRYDRVAFPNEGRLKRYVEAGIVAPEQAVLVGYPKADALARTTTCPRDAMAGLGLDPSRRTIVYAPTFSPASSLSVAGEAIVGTLIDSGYNVIVKLHDRSLDPDPKYSGGVDWRQRLSRLAAERRRFLFASGGDSTPYLQASDLMVTDHSSIGFEFCVLDRPLVVWDVPQLAGFARINPEKWDLLRSAAAVVRDTAELRKAVAVELESPGRRAAARGRAVAAVFHHPGGAADRALRLIYELLHLTPAADLAVQQPARAWSGIE
jgi:hypothetical protein